jgi:hypothetical protein
VPNASPIVQPLPAVCDECCDRLELRHWARESHNCKKAIIFQRDESLTSHRVAIEEGYPNGKIRGGDSSENADTSFTARISVKASEVVETKCCPLIDRNRVASLLDDVAVRGESLARQRLRSNFNQIGSPLRVFRKGEAGSLHRQGIY